MLYQVVTINAKILAFTADEVELEDGIYTFYYDGEEVGKFKRDNIAGYFVDDMEFDDDEDEWDADTD